MGDAGQSITATPYRGPCSSGPDCLVVGFTIDGWATHPMGWVCEFSSGARYAFEFEEDGADPACSTVDVPDSIVIDIDGLRDRPDHDRLIRLSGIVRFLPRRRPRSAAR